VPQSKLAAGLTADDVIEEVEEHGEEFLQ